MANTFEQKYPVNTRIISGLVNVPYQDDVVLLCNTAAGPVGIQLLQIPLNSDNKGVWSTQYKLYIVDNNNNAAANNITITAPPGYLINGAGSFVITANNASLIVRITSNTTYAGQYSVISGGGGSGYNQIQDEGVNLVQRPTMNFKGNGVIAIDNGGGNKTDILIEGAHVIEDEGVAVPQRLALNFTGAGVTVIDNAGKTEVQIPGGGGGGGYNLIQDEGVPLPAQTTIDFVGAGVLVTDGPGAKTTVTIPGGGGGSTQYLYARKNLNNNTIVYFPINPAPTYSVVSGTLAQAYDSKVESGVTGFDLLTGIWTVPATGKYSISAKLITRLLEANVDSIVDSGGLQWQNGGGLVGTFAIGIIALSGGSKQIIASNKQPSLLESPNSDINIDCSTLIMDLTIGDSVVVQVLNKTQHDVNGIADTFGLPSCYMDLSIIKVA